MQNRNLWYLASAAAIVIVLFGILAIVPLTSTLPSASGDAAESIALVATQVIDPTGEAQAQVLDMADSGADNDALQSPVDDTVAEESIERDDPATGLDSTANTEAESSDTSSRTNIAIEAVQTTATALTNLFSTTQSANFVAPTATAQPLSIAQGGGMASDSPAAPASVMAESETTIETGDVDSASTGIETTGAIVAQAPAEAEDGNQEPDISIAESDESDDEAVQDDSLTNTASIIETRASVNDTSNLVQAVLNAMRRYIESRQA